MILILHSDSRSSRNDQGIWSGEATRLRGINDTTRVDIRIGDAATAKPATQEKSRPIWMVESSIGHSATDVLNALFTFTKMYFTVYVVSWLFGSLVLFICDLQLFQTFLSQPNHS
jgi:hypothetical protein